MRAMPDPACRAGKDPHEHSRIRGDILIRSIFRLNPILALLEVQQTFQFSDESLSTRFNVPVSRVQNWRQGSEHPSPAIMKQMSELLALDEALTNARSGKYRQA
jgi:DNA-binding transcriptional regulator YiaG